MKTLIIISSFCLFFSFKAENKQSENRSSQGIEIHLMNSFNENPNSYLKMTSDEQGRYFEKIDSVEDIPDNVCKNFIDISANRIQNKSFLSKTDIESYSIRDHTINLTSSGIAKLSELIIPIQGMPFVLKVNGETILSGWFWNQFSSEGCDRVYGMVFPGANNIKLRFGVGSFKCGKNPLKNESYLNSILSEDE